MNPDLLVNQYETLEDLEYDELGFVVDEAGRPRRSSPPLILNWRRFDKLGIATPVFRVCPGGPEIINL